VENFELTFAKIYPDFTKNLVRETNNFTPQEIKVCMCIKMSFSNAKIQEHLKISKSTLSNLRSSVRHKLGIKRSKNLSNAILCI
jgi:DNA-binding CsgD family transcriptional regulator